MCARASVHLSYGGGSSANTGHPPRAFPANAGGCLGRKETALYTLSVSESRPRDFLFTQKQQLVGNVLKSSAAAGEARAPAQESFRVHSMWHRAGVINAEWMNE